MTPQKKFDGGSFEPIKVFPKIFFTGSFSGSGPEIHRSVRTLEEVWVGTTYSCYQFSLFISSSPRKRVLDFKIQKKTQLLHSKKKTQLLRLYVCAWTVEALFYMYSALIVVCARDAELNFNAQFKFLKYKIRRTQFRTRKN